ncbi:MAG: hypothetical protein WC599_14155, partial [Bacteroidales bacterium]
SDTNKQIYNMRNISYLHKFLPEIQREGILKITVGVPQVLLHQKVVLMIANSALFIRYVALNGDNFL